MSDRVVDLLEVVEVDEQQPHALVAAPRPAEREAEQFLEQRSVRQAGELVVVGEERELIGVALAGDVEDEALHEPGLARRSPDRGRPLEHPPNRAVLVHHAVLTL